MSVILSNQEFLEGLATFYDITKEKGSVWITIKRVPSDVENRPFACQIRAKIDRSHHPSSLCTKVSPNNVFAFSNSLAGLMKHKCTSLKNEG
mmetsp:Transcript_12057/g.12126  ORF Transcript_12057/g.12126 Transcript_12057/m.12126 type:complete len:92 (+) Transcript_12057:134-409(+)